METLFWGSLKEYCLSDNRSFQDIQLQTGSGRIFDENVMEAEKNNQYFQHVQEIIKKYKTLWFNDEMFIIEHQE